MDDERGRKKLAIIILLLLLIAAAAAAVWLSQGEDEQTWKVTVEVEGEGTADPMEAAIEDGGTLTIQLTPAEGWELSEVYLDGELTNFAGREFTISDIREDHKVRAVFVEIVPVPTSYTLTVVSNDGGSTDPTGESVRSVGEKVRVSAVPDEGSVIGDVRVDGTSVGAMNVLDVEMDSDHTIEFVFREASSTGENTDPVVTIDVDVVVTLRTTGADAETSGSSAASFGTITPSGKVRVAYGGSLTITMTLNEGYALVSVTAGGKSIEPAPEFTVKDITSDVGIAIVVSGPTFSIVSSAGTGGSISPSGETLVLIGSSQTYTISPSSGYRISSVTVDGVSVGAVTSYTFSDVATDHSISASFVRSSTPSPSPGPSPGPTPSTPTLTSLTVTGAPTAVYVGDAPDFSRMTVTAVYSVGSTRALSSSQYTISPDPSVPIAEAGTYTYTVSYGGISKDIQVAATVQQFTVTITAGTGGTVSQTTLTVDRGTTLSVLGNVLTVGTVNVVATPTSPSVFSCWTLNGKTLYGTMTLTGDIEVTAVFASLDSVSVTTPPTRTLYFVGDSFDPEGMVVTARYSDGSTAPVFGYSYMPDGELSSTDDRITIAYGGMTCTQAISVSYWMTISVQQPPEKLLYDLNEEVLLEGAVITVAYHDGTTVDVTRGFTVSADTSSEGPKTATVTYNEGGYTATTTFDIYVAFSVGFNAYVISVDGIDIAPVRLDRYNIDGPMAPGDSVVLSIEIRNNTSIAVSPSLVLEYLTGSDDVCRAVSVFCNGHEFSVLDMKGGASVELDDIASGGKSTVTVKIAMDPLVGNELMQKSLSFRLGIFADGIPPAGGS